MFAFSAAAPTILTTWKSVDRKSNRRCLLPVLDDNVSVVDVDFGHIVYNIVIVVVDVFCVSIKNLVNDLQLCCCSDGPLLLFKNNLRNVNTRLKSLRVSKCEAV